MIVFLCFQQAEFPDLGEGEMHQMCLEALFSTQTLKYKKIWQHQYLLNEHQYSKLRLRDISKLSAKQHSTFSKVTLDVNHHLNHQFYGKMILLLLLTSSTGDCYEISQVICFNHSKDLIQLQKYQLLLIVEESVLKQF